YTAVAPTLSGILPTSGSIAGGTTITLTGTGFIPGMSVTLGGSAATNVTVVNSTTLTAVTPIHASGAVDVIATNSMGSATLTGGFTYVTLAPTLSGLSPITGSVAGGTNVTLTGANLTGTTSVTFGGVAATNVVVVSDTSVTATVPAYVSGALLVDVTVSNGAANATLTGAFTYLAVSPTLSTISPNTGSIAGGTVATITGAGFIPGTTVTIGGIPATVTAVSATTITLSTPAYVSGSLVKNVVVTNTAGSATLTGGFTYTASAPTLASISPSAGPTAGGTTVTLTGTGFTPTTTVTIGGIAATGITVNSATSITAVTPAYVSGALAVNVVVNNGVSNAVLSGGFTYQPAAPTIVSISPNSGSMAGGTAVTVSGTNFTPTTTLTIGGIAATSVTVVNATTLTAVTPAYVSGSLVNNVVVSNSVGNATLTNGFTYIASSPSLISISPNSGPMSGGTLVTLTGTDFTPTTTLTIGGIAATSVTVVNATTLTAVTPAYVSGSLVSNVVVNNGVGSATLTGGYTYVAVMPSISGVTPNTGPVAGGTSITISGTGFTPTTSVTVDGIPATSITINSATSLTAITPAYVSGPLAANVVVSNEIGGATLAGGFTYQASSPTLISITPNQGSMAGGSSVTVVGTNFTPTTTLTIGGVAAMNVTVVNATTLTATTPAYVSGALVKDVVVTNTAGSATLTGGFTYTAVAPTLTGLSPTTGPVSGNTTITLSGSGFIPGATVTVGGVAATNVTVVNATTITASTPAYVSGSLIVDVLVNNGVGSASLVGGFTYTAVAPTLSGILPTSGSIAGGTTITLTGTGFIPGMSVTLGGSAATNV
ncbi:IPT/TIG domain-containing protein, partial [Silvimonas sp.]|uniref:beta strand repeat-containing protein n=1 Tax=Silvimonas sp. TaxID=2650811 RepID=UPI002844F89A